MLEYFGVATGLLYMALEIKQHPALWVVGFVTSLVYVFVFFLAKLYADMGLQAWYVLMSVYGFRLWTKADSSGEESAPAPGGIVYRHANAPALLTIVLAIAAIHFSLYGLLVAFTDSPIPHGDAFITAVGIVATWMLARRIIEHWYLWIIVNAVSVYIYYLRALYPTMFLYLCYTLLAAAGLYTWIKKGTEQR
ncbi:MAG: nicotinamide riboside transporter PnuC [Tannerellaceae bacterium]|jgi:nicotinamide mononucleotide transporter|nr:nicotinamide riboside transporter PnuC [Tannerellaceae bacterium]